MSQINFNLKRVRQLNTKEQKEGPVVYWMQRDQRVEDNWALLYANYLTAGKHPIAVVFNLVPGFLGAGLRQYDFMLKGLAEVEERLREKNIAFFLLNGEPQETISRFVKKHKASALVTDFSPLKISRGWKHGVTAKLSVPFYEVDAHNIVPAWVVSSKQEFGAYTIRPKIHRLLPEFLTDLPKIPKQKFIWKGKKEKIKWAKVLADLKPEKHITCVDWLKSGETAAKKALNKFLSDGLKYYSKHRNDPNLLGQSELSPYLHFGNLSAQKAAFLASLLPASESRESFMEELIVRRELADNYCFYNSNYDSVKGFPAWAKKTLQEHREDKREYLYSLKELEAGKTHDELWNAAQLEMVYRGKMHNYMRMYWAKKILEWTPSPEVALKYTIYLNDKYELDGRDPNGYVGAAWSIGGVHDRAWGERKIFGKIRYMSYNGAKGKFNIKDYIDKVNQLAGKTLL